jgi:hypothetical protein
MSDNCVIPTPSAFDNKVRFCAQGKVYTLPRVLNKTNPVEAEVKLEFKLYFVDYYADSVLHRLGDEYTTAKLTDKVRQSFATANIYTDLDGVIQPFSEPREAWWIEIDQLRWTVQKMRTEQESVYEPPIGA